MWWLVALLSRQDRSVYLPGDEHYTVTKSSSDREQDVEGSLASAELKDPTPDVLDQPIVEEALASLMIGPAISIADPLQSNVSKLVPGTAQNVVGLGRPLSASPRECALLDDTSSQGC